jgi:divalent metal cation (Fe/Co/Zn/Cd) transporter
MATHAVLEQANWPRRIRLLSWLTVAWLAIDGVVGMTAGITANSIALIGWGLDCAIEVAASVVLIWRFSGSRVDSRRAERLAQQAVAVSFLLLVPYIVTTALMHLLTGNAAGSSWIGITLAATDAALMPLLGRAKQRAGEHVGSHATKQAGLQNILCAYLSVAVLVGLALNALIGWWWADPIAALVVAAACLVAGINTWRGEDCEEPICE